MAQRAESKKNRMGTDPSRSQRDPGHIQRGPLPEIFESDQRTDKNPHEMKTKDQEQIRKHMTASEVRYETYLMELKGDAWSRLEDLYRMQRMNMHTDPGELREAIEMQSTRWRTICECRREFYEIIKKRIQNQHLN
tara:strand:+ start:350 stop:757 length:408 start_codon:yes stop_codon:yes gene_type:complete